MAIVFKPETHSYVSIDPNENISWTSVTSVISKFKKPFDADTIALKSSKNKKSKWYGMTPDAIKEAWKSESNRAMSLGTWYHEQRERDILSCESISREDIVVPVFKPIESDGIKKAPDQKLSNGVYPEHMVYLKSAGLCGQADRVEVVNGKVNIYDYKTNKEIKSTGYTNWEGITDKMLRSKHNPRLKPGKMIIEHILFKEAGKDAYDNRVVLYDQFGEPVVDKIVQYEVPYLKTEVINIINKLRDNGKA